MAVRVDPLPWSIFGPEGGRTEVEVAMADRPLLFSTVLATLERAGLAVQRFFHPIMGVDRSHDGRIRGIGTALGAQDQEVLVHVEVDKALNNDAQAQVAADVAAAIEDLMAAARDADAVLRVALEEAATRLEQLGPQRYDAQDGSSRLLQVAAAGIAAHGLRHVPGDQVLGVCGPDEGEAPLDPRRGFAARPLAVRRSLRPPP